MDKISYIDDDINKGIKVDWKKVHKEIKKLKIPTEIYNPLYMQKQNITAVHMTPLNPLLIQ